MAKIKIKTIWGILLFEGNFSSLKEAVLARLKSSADLCGADLRGADLRSADLRDADLRGADLRSADLRDADLRSADLRGADLRSADLRDADLRGANLCGAKGAEFEIAQTRILPEGDIVGWKKCKSDVIVKLSIPAAAKRSSAFGRKCRAEYAIVLDVIGAKQGVSSFDSSIVYKKGETVKPKEAFSDNWQKECASGIHFFITRLEAEKYVL